MKTSKYAVAVGATVVRSS